MASTERDFTPESGCAPRLRTLEYVTIPNCADCRRFERVLAAVLPEYPTADVRAVESDSPRGMAISVGRGVMRFPIVLLDDEIIAVERISEADLRRALEGDTRP